MMEIESYQSPYKGFNRKEESMNTKQINVSIPL